MKKLINALFTFVRRLLHRNKTASEAFLSANPRCSECGKPIANGEAMHIGGWICNECLGVKDDGSPPAGWSN